MSNLVQRTYPRIVMETPIQYSHLNSGDFRSTRSLNFSVGGLCYQTDQQLAPLAEVCIVMDNYAPGRFGPEGYRSYLARICWTQPLSALHKGILAAGAQIIARSHELLTGAITEPRHICDLCGALKPASRLQSTDGGTQLCEHCYKHFSAMPQGKISQCVNRFLTGNVV